MVQIVQISTRKNCVICVINLPPDTFQRGFAKKLTLKGIQHSLSKVIDIAVARI